MELVRILQSVDWPAAFAHPDATLDSLFGARAAVVGLLEALNAEVEHRFESGLGALPAEAQSLRDDTGWTDDNHKSLIKATAQYVVRAAPYAHESKLVKANVRQLLGLGPAGFHHEPGLGRCMRRAAGRHPRPHAQAWRTTGRPVPPAGPGAPPRRL
jgi:hypothetical protein